MATTEVRPSRCVRDLLEAVYPTVRWDAVSFYAGLPSGVKRFTNVAITLPMPLGTRGLGIYIAETHFNQCTPAGLGLLVHECFHVLQFQERLGGVGLGPLRGFTVQYLFRAIFEGGGKENRYEVPAYALEKAFIAACKALPHPLCDCHAGTIDRAMLDQLLRLNPWLVHRTSRKD